MTMMKRAMDLLQELGKVRISSLATISMVTGYILGRGGVDWALLGLVAGVFAIACAASAINHIQDRDLDARMQRTQGRPIPSGRISVARAGAFALVMLLVGLSTIAVFGGGLAAVLGFIAVFWYNAVYTPLKRVTAFAAVPGGLVGAIPPVIGWVAAGGSATDPRILAVAFFFFIWQVPHFWLLILFSAGYDYERAGLPSLTRLFSHEQIARITFVWIFATAVACLLIPLFGILSSPWFNIALSVAAAWLIWRCAGILRGSGVTASGRMAFRLAFKHINMYVFWVITVLAASGITS